MSKKSTSSNLGIPIYATTFVASLSLPKEELFGTAAKAKVTLPIRFPTALKSFRHRIWIAFACIVLTILALLLVYFGRKHDYSIKKSNHDIIKCWISDQHFDSLGLSQSGKLILASEDWNFLPNLANKENEIHFSVTRAIEEISPYGQRLNYITPEIHGGKLRISGRPMFCNQSDEETPEHLVFTNVSHLHLSHMNDCFNYVNIILTKWHFPNVQLIKFHKMVIQKQEFVALTKFIHKHNETLHKVVIDESYICPSPDCEIGMIDFPNDDFQMVITRRRESQKLV